MLNAMGVSQNHSEQKRVHAVWYFRMEVGQKVERISEAPSVLMYEYKWLKNMDRSLRSVLW